MPRRAAVQARRACGRTLSRRASAQARPACACSARMCGRPAAAPYPGLRPSAVRQCERGRPAAVHCPGVRPCKRPLSRRASAQARPACACSAHMCGRPAAALYPVRACGRTLSRRASVQARPACGRTLCRPPRRHLLLLKGGCSEGWVKRRKNEVSVSHLHAKFEIPYTLRSKRFLL